MKSKNRPDLSFTFINKTRNVALLKPHDNKLTSFMKTVKVKNEASSIQYANMYLSIKRR